MKYFRKIAVATALFGSVIGLNSHPAAAMNFYEEKVDTAKGPMFILHMDGKINIGDTERMLTFLYGVINRYGLTSPMPGAVVSLNSEGGSVVEAAKMAALMRKSQQAVAVDNGRTCASACFLLFAAGEPRFAATTAFVAVHSVSDTRYGETLGAAATTVVMARSLGEMGVPSDLIGKLVQTPPDKYYRLTIADLTAMRTNFMSAPAAAPTPRTAPNYQAVQPRKKVCETFPDGRQACYW